MSRVGCHRWGWVALVAVVLGLLILSPTRAEAQDPSPVIIPGLPGAGLPAGARPAPTAWPYTDLPGGKAATPTGTTEAPTDETEKPTDTTESQPSAAPPYGLTGNWYGARRPVRQGDRSSHEPLAVLPGSDQRGTPPDLPLRTQVRLLRDHRGREAPRLGGSVHQPPRRKPFRREHQPRRRLPGPCQLRSRVSQAGGKRLGLDQHAGRAVPGTQFRRYLRQAQRRRRRQHPPVPGWQRHQSLHE